MKKGEIKMDYKEEYQKALERAKKGLPIDEVFPELKESEDERIRKELVEYFSRTGCNFIRGIPIERVMDYLEKLKDIDCLACDQHLKGYIAGRKVTEEEKQKKQQPAEWSEEDENVLCMIECDIKCQIAEGNTPEKEGSQRISWLKSLRPSWKPSEEQIDALEWMLTTVSMKDGGRGVVLKNLINDLKKQM